MSKCSKCGGLGYITDETSLNIKEWCSCIKKDNYIHKLRKAGLHKVYQDYTFDKYEVKTDWQHDYKQRVIAYAKQPRGWFVFLGQTGIGKTHLLSALSVHLIKYDYHVKYVNWFNLINKAKSNYHKLDESYMQELREVEVLYLDDFLKASSLDEIASWQYDIAFDLIASRYNNPDLITLISSEWNVQDFLSSGKRWHALIGRIVEMCGGLQSSNLINAGYKEDGNYRLQ